MRDRDVTARPEKLLVVDDDARNRETLKQFLEAKGYEVALAASGEQAMEMVDRTGLDLVLLGLSLPRTNGLEVLKHLRGEFSPGELPVIMVSEENETSSVVEALTFGANDYISKPIEPGVAIARIKTQLARKKFEKELRADAEELNGVGDRAEDGRWTWNLDTNHVTYSPSWKAMVGCVNGEIGASHREWLSRVHPDDQALVKSAIQRSVGTAGAPEAGEDQAMPALEVEHRLRKRDGSYVWVLAKGGVVTGPGGNRCLAGSMTDVTGHKRLEPGTDLPLEHQFIDWITVAQSKETAGEPGLYSVALFGVDRLQAVRQGLGDSAAADLLRHFADGFGNWQKEGETRRSDGLPAGARVQMARLSESEFGALISGCQSDADIVHFARRVQQALDVSVKLGGARVYASVSAGLIPNVRTYTTAAELLRDARTAVEKARSLGGGHALTFLPQMRDIAVDKLELEHDLRSAVARKEFELYYQPKVHLEGGGLEGFEALVRWRHPRRGQVSPGDFIPLAEHTGLIIPIGDWVLEEACRQTREWQLRFPAHAKLSVGVNVSSRQLEDSGLAKRVAKVLAETGLAPECLALEITESALVSDGPEVRNLLEELRSQRVGLHIDDFGTGYSALQYLQRLPFDTLKIDKSFVDRLGATRENTEITRAIIALAHHLHLDVVSEGIETQEQLNILRDFGARVGQGYLFSRPLSKEQAEELLEHGFEYDMEALLSSD